MSRVDKLLEAMRNNPSDDWTIGDIQRLCGQLGWQCLPPSGGSHWKVMTTKSVAILTVPARRPIKPIYIRKLVAMIDEVKNGKAD